MNKEQIFEKVKSILTDSGFKPVVYGSKFVEDLDMDLIDVVTLLTTVERLFKLHMEESFFTKVDSVAKLCSYLYLKSNQND